VCVENDMQMSFACVFVRQEALPDWKDKHDMLSALRACSYNPHQCIATYLDWGDTSMFAGLFVSENKKAQLTQRERATAVHV